MYGLFPALMESQRFRADQEQRAADAAMRQRQLAMQEQSHGLNMQEGNLRLEGLRRQRQTADDLAASIDAEGAPGPVSNMPMIQTPPEGPGFLEANGVAPMPTPPVGLQRPGASGFDRAAMKAAAQSGNIEGVYKIKDRVKAEGQDASRKSEFKRLMGMSDADLVAAFEPMNAHPGVKGMLNFDPKTKQFLLVSQIPGLETQSMTKEELVNSMMGIWEAGNGDFNAGMNRMMQGAQRRRDIDNSNFDRSGKLAGMNADAYFKGRTADSTDAQRAEQSRHNRAMEGNANARLGLERARVESADWKIVGTTGDKKGLLYFNERTGKTEARPLPEGADADGLFRKLTGQGSQNMTRQQELELRAKLKTAGYDDAAIEQMVTGYDPMAAMQAGIQKLVEERKAKAGAKPEAAAPAPVTYETMPLQTLQGYTGTSPEARAVYERRLAEQQRLSANPRFWVQPQGEVATEFGLDRGY